MKQTGAFISVQESEGQSCGMQGWEGTLVEETVSRK